MRRFFIVFAALVLFANSACADTMWGVTGSRYPGTDDAHLFNFDSDSGALGGTMYSLETSLNAANIYGLAVAGDVALLSYYDGVAEERSFAAVDLTDGSVIESSATGGIRWLGLSWDGTNLYGQRDYINTIDIINLNGTTLTGTSTGAALGVGYLGDAANSYWTALPGQNPVTGDYYGFLGPQSYQKGSDFNSGTTLTYSGRGNELDQPGAMTFASDGTLLATRWEGLNVYTDDPDVTAISNWSTLYTIDFTGTDAEGVTTIGGLSRVGPALPNGAVPEPASVLIWAFLGMLGIGLSRRR